MAGIRRAGQPRARRPGGVYRCVMIPGSVARSRVPAVVRQVMLLVPILLNRWQGFYNEVKGITGNSSETPCRSPSTIARG